MSARPVVVVKVALRGLRREFVAGKVLRYKLIEADFARCILRATRAQTPAIAATVFNAIF